MAKHPNNKPKPVKREDPMTGAMKFFLAGCVAELYLLVIRRFYILGNIREVVAWDEYLKYFSYAGIAVLAIGVVLTFLWKADKKKRVIGFSAAAAGAYLAVVSAAVRMNLSLVSLLIVIVPAIVILGILWCLYDRECALSLTVLGVSLVMVWAARRAIYLPAVKVIVVLFLLALVAAALLTRKVKQSGGKLGKLQFLPAKANVTAVYVSCGLSLVAVATVLVNTTIAYYALWLLAAVVFALAVYYTVKQL